MKGRKGRRRKRRREKKRQPSPAEGIVIVVVLMGAGDRAGGGGAVVVVIGEREPRGRRTEGEERAGRLWGAAGGRERLCVMELLLLRRGPGGLGAAAVRGFAVVAGRLA